MSLEVGTGKASEVTDLLTALQRGRDDHEFFGAFFLNRPPHDGYGRGGQLKWLEEAQASVNVLATANRFGKTTLLSHGHFHSGMYKVGAEPFYLNPDGTVDLDRFLRTRYHTVHTAGDWETTRLVWDEAQKLIQENYRLKPFIKEHPLSLPPHIRGVNGFLWKFRTLGHDSRGIDGNSFYLVSIDEAGWIDGLEEMMQNVIRVRVADVRGRIWLVGTFKPGISIDFYKYAVRASKATGIAIGFDHRDATVDEREDGSAAQMDGSIRRYLSEFGIDLDEYADALKGE